MAARKTGSTKIRRASSVWAIAPLAFASCVAWVPPPVEPYFSGRLDEAEQIFERRLDEQADDWALMANELAMTHLAAGRVEEARRLFLRAGQYMTFYDSTFGQSFAAIAGREDSKVYKGDSYEQAFNSLYTGIVLWLWGELDNGRALFKEALLRDYDDETERGFSDLSIAHFLAAWASRDMGLSGDQREFLTEARRARRFAVQHGARGPAEPLSFDRLDDANLLLIASIGRGPEKAPSGKYREMVVMQPFYSHLAKAHVTVNGQPLGNTEILADVYYQSTTRGGRFMEGIRKGKAVFKDMSAISGILLINHGLAHRHEESALVGLGLLLLSALTAADADLRCWRTLPDTIQVLAGRLQPGTYELGIDFLDVSSHPQPAYRRSLDVTIPERGTTLVHVHSLPIAGQ